MKYSKQILVIVLALAPWLMAQGALPTAQGSQLMTPPTAGVPTERNFSSDLALPKVDAPSPFDAHQGAITPQQLYSPATSGNSFNAGELQRVSSGQIISVGGGAGAAASGGAISATGSYSDPAMSAFSVNPMPVRKHRDFVSADELLDLETNEDSKTVPSKQRLPLLPEEDDLNDSNQMGAPITDTPWLLLLLACAAFVGVRRRRCSGEC